MYFAYLSLPHQPEHSESRHMQFSSRCGYRHQGAVFAVATRPAPDYLSHIRTTVLAHAVRLPRVARGLRRY